MVNLLDQLLWQLLSRLQKGFKITCLRNLVIRSYDSGIKVVDANLEMSHVQDWLTANISYKLAIWGL